MCRPSWPVIPVTNARFTAETLSAGVLGDLIPRRLQLVEEGGAPVCLVGLADRGRDSPEPGPGPQEASVRRMCPPDVARPPPPGSPEPGQDPPVHDSVAS